MKHSLSALSACALFASVATAAPAAKTPAKPAAKAPVKVAAKAPAKIAAKPVAKAVVAPAPKVAPTTIAQATPGMMKAEEMPGFFPDVPRDHWAFAAVQRLAAAGIVQGYPANQTPKPAKVVEAPAQAKKDNVKVADKTGETTERVEVAAAPATEQAN